MATEAMKWHPAAEAYPMMEGTDYERLKESVARQGILKPIEVYAGTAWPEFEGVGIDGRNRAKAAAECGVECPKRQLTDEDIGGSITDYITSVNSVRRHEDASMRAAIAVNLEACFSEEAKQRMREGGGDKRSAEAARQRLENPAISGKEKIPYPIQKGQARAKAAKVAEVNERYVSDAKKLSQEAPSLFEKLQRGRIKLPAAMAALKRKDEDYEAWELLLEGAIKVEEFNARCDLKLKSAVLWIEVARGDMSINEAIRKLKEQAPEQEASQPHDNAPTAAEPKPDSCRSTDFPVRAANGLPSPCYDEKPVATMPVTPTVPADLLGRPTPEDLVPVFEDAWKLLGYIETLSRLTKEFSELQLCQTGKHFRFDYRRLLPWVESFRRELEWGGPKCVCPSCHGTGQEGEKGPCSCSVCHGLGWIANGRYKELSADLILIAESYGASRVNSGQAAA